MWRCGLCVHVFFSNYILLVLRESPERPPLDVMSDARFEKKLTPDYYAPPSFIQNSRLSQKYFLSRSDFLTSISGLPTACEDAKTLAVYPKLSTLLNGQLTTVCSSVNVTTLATHYDQLVTMSLNATEKKVRFSFLFNKSKYRQQNLALLF